MTPEKILEIAHRYSEPETTVQHDGKPNGPFYRMTHWLFCQEDLIPFAQAIIEAERESSDKPVAWMDTSGRIKGIPANIGSNECAPLYRRPPPTRKLTDEDINDCHTKAWKSLQKYQQGIRGQQLNAQDSFNWHFAKAIERRINGEEE